MKKTAFALLTVMMALILCFSSPVEVSAKKSNTKYSSSYKKSTTKKNTKKSYKKNTKKSTGSGSYKKSSSKKSSSKKSSKKSCQEWPDCDDYWDEDEFLDDWDGNMPDDSDAMDYWDNW